MARVEYPATWPRDREGRPLHGKAVPVSERVRHGLSFVHALGYRMLYLPWHPAALASGYVYEHRVVAERKIGRLLEPGEQVHHVNGDKLDNRAENLEVFPSADAHRAHHMGLRRAA